MSFLVILVSLWLKPGTHSPPSCHPERSEGSQRIEDRRDEILLYSQNDKINQLTPYHPNDNLLMDLKYFQNKGGDLLILIVNEEQG